MNQAVGQQRKGRIHKGRTFRFRQKRLQGNRHKFYEWEVGKGTYSGTGWWKFKGIFYTNKEYTMRINEIPFVSIIIVTYKAINYVRRCIDSIITLTPEIPYELIIIDNNSGSEMKKYLLGLTHLNNVKIIFNNKNRLLTPAQNQGIKVMHEKSKCVLFLMPDSIVLRSDWLEILLTGLDKNFVGIVGPVCNYFPTKPMYGNIDMNGLLVRKDVLESIGGLDERYKMDGGGLSLCVAAYTRGFLWCHINRPKIIYHYGKKSRDENPMPRERVNRNEVYRKHGIKPRWSLYGAMQQVIKRPDSVIQHIKEEIL